MVDKKHLELLQFDKVVDQVRKKCYSERAREMCNAIAPTVFTQNLQLELERTQEIRSILSGQGYFPTVEHEDVYSELNYLSRDGSQLQEEQLLSLSKTVTVSNSVLRFVKGKKLLAPQLFAISEHLVPNEEVVIEIDKVIDSEAQVRDQASPELQRIRRAINEKQRESDRKFYQYVAQLRKEGFLRENEEGFFNGRRTLAVLVENKSEVQGFVHGKSESGKTIFIEPGITMALNNDVAELQLDERREVNRLLRALCAQIRVYAADLKKALDFLVYCDFLKAKGLYATELNACLPLKSLSYELKVTNGYHPLLLQHNKALGKATVPLSLSLNAEKRLLVISGPNAGGKTIALKTVGLLQIMLQSGLLIPVSENSEFCFFENILVDIGDTQSIENELSTYSAKLRSMTEILNCANEASLVLMDEFGSGTDPELGSAIAESVLESLESSKTKGIITSHFGNVKLLADKLPGTINGSMLFDISTMQPRYILSVGEPGSSYTFEVAEKIGFPKHLIQRARQKVSQDKLRLNGLLAEVQDQKAKLAQQLDNLEHELFLGRLAKEKYDLLFRKWEEKINGEREKKIELARLADFGQKYLRLMDDWNDRKDRKEVIKRFIDGITAETRKQEAAKKQNKLDAFAEKKVARLKLSLKVGSKVRVLNGNEVGIVQEIRDDKVIVQFGLMKMTVGMQNLLPAGND